MPKGLKRRGRGGSRGHHHRATPSDLRTSYPGSFPVNVRRVGPVSFLDPVLGLVTVDPDPHIRR